MRTYSISFNGNAPESWAHTNLIDAFDSREIAAITALVSGQKLHLNDGTRVSLVEG
jgi:hypothetical protein